MEEQFNWIVNPVSIYLNRNKKMTDLDYMSTNKNQTTWYCYEYDRQNVEDRPLCLSQKQTHKISP